MFSDCTFGYSDKSEIEEDAIFKLFSESQKNKYFKLLLSDVNEDVDIIESIGEGSFGQVYKINLVQENYNIKAAMKYIKKTPSYGLNSLLELYIMYHLKEYNYLTKACNINIDTLGDFQIIQPLAISDAKIFLKNNKVEKNIIAKWQSNIICAVSHLHSKGILHGDIKAKNLLIYEPNLEIKLTDFGLSIILLDSNVSSENNVLYTPTHRPLEIFKGETFSYSSDIWALGCTFYELEYKDLLFPVCKTDEGYIRNLENFKFVKKNKFNNMLNLILQKNKINRPSIFNLSEHSYFKPYLNIFELPITQYYPKFLNLGLTLDEKISNFTNLLFLKCNQEISKETCYIVVHKLVYNYPPLNIGRFTYKQLQEEIKLCKIVNFDYFP